MRKACPSYLRVTSALFIVVFAAACTTAQPGEAFPDKDGVKRFQAAQFDEQLKRMFTALGDRSLKGTFYSHVTYGAAQSSKETDISYLKETTSAPPAFITRSKSGIEGDNIDTYHPANSDIDYLLLGKLYTSLAPTIWVQMPTFYPQDGLNYCLIPGIQRICDFEGIVNRAIKSKGDNIVKQAQQSSTNGTWKLVIGVSLSDILTNPYVLSLQENMIKEVNAQPAMLNTLLRLTITLNREGQLQKMELNGEVPGKQTLSMQVGFEIKGKASKADLPPLPVQADITVLPDEAARKDFFDRLSKI